MFSLVEDTGIRIAPCTEAVAFEAWDWVVLVGPGVLAGGVRRLFLIQRGREEDVRRQQSSRNPAELWEGVL